MTLLRRYFPTLVWLATLLVFAGVIARTTVVADLSAFIGKPISLSAEPTMNPEQYDIVLT